MNGTSILAALPEGRKVVGPGWIYRLKISQCEGKIKAKARLVDFGNLQPESIDYLNTFPLTPGCLVDKVNHRIFP